MLCNFQKMYPKTTPQAHPQVVMEEVEQENELEDTHEGTQVDQGRVTTAGQQADEGGGPSAVEDTGPQTEEGGGPQAVEDEEASGEIPRLRRRRKEVNYKKFY